MRLDIINDKEDEIINFCPLFRPVSHSTHPSQPYWHLMNYVYLRRKETKKLRNGFIKPIFRSMGDTFGDEKRYKAVPLRQFASGDHTVREYTPHFRMPQGIYSKTRKDNLRLDKMYSERKNGKRLTDGWMDVLLKRYNYNVS